MIDVASGRALAKKTPGENSQQFGVRVDYTPRKVNEVMHFNIKTQLSEFL